MFRRKLKADFDVFEKSFFDTNEDKNKQYDRTIYVVYEKKELLSILQENINANALVCLFDKQFYTSLSLLEIMNNVILFDDCKTSRELFSEMKTFFKKKFDLKNKKISMKKTFSVMSPEYHKAMYYLM
ncbi:hypothetical protein K6T82_04605 [Flavobacterium sp. 17A]|uniref:Uncharacterized protein n=1 Tax=Flavobacterium potami TaxID=2872310 RepID=A0A9X1H796_9FLAO|nr:hypothetical protein [Flavobacterium potami]MBZ4034034.1 hypothetical protein [Flavobacterium potami]